MVSLKPTRRDVDFMVIIPIITTTVTVDKHGVTSAAKKPQKSLKGDITQHHVDFQAM